VNFTTTGYNPVGPTLISIAGHPFFGNLSGNVLPDGSFSFSLTPPTPAILGTDVSGTVWRRSFRSRAPARWSRLRHWHWPRGDAG
jgi:hypothetical protein